MTDSSPAPHHDRVLIRTLMHAFCWFDDGLQRHMVRETGLSLPRAQSMIMICLTEGITSQTELARRLRVSKQAIRQALRAMMDKGMVALERDPGNGRQKLVKITPRGEAMRKVAQAALDALEAELERRIGADRVAALHDALNADWGPKE